MSFRIAKRHALCLLGNCQLKPIPVVLMHGAPPRMLHEPLTDTLAVVATQALQPRHRDTHFELLQTDGAFGVVDAVLLRGEVGMHADGPRQRRAR